MKKGIIFLLFLCILTGCGNNIYKENVQTKTEYGNNNLDDVIAKINQIKCAEEYAPDVKVQDFDSVYFGRYEQDGVEINGQEKIEWIIIDKDLKHKRLVLMSKYILDYKTILDVDDFEDYEKYYQYLDKDYKIVLEITFMYLPSLIPWDKSDIMEWANSDFINIAFNDDEKIYMFDESIIIPKSNIKKKIFPLPKNNIKKSFKNENQLSADKTLFAKLVIQNKTDKYSYYNDSYLTLEDNEHLAWVNHGSLEYTFLPSSAVVGFRPCICIGLNELISFDDEYKNMNVKDSLKLVTTKLNDEEIDFKSKYDVYIGEQYNIYVRTMYSYFNKMKEFLDVEKDSKNYTFGPRYLIEHDDANKPLIRFSYALIDLDNNGIKELVIFHGSDTKNNDYKDQLIGVYTIFNGNLIEMLSRDISDSSSSDNKYYLTDDGEILNKTFTIDDMRSDVIFKKVKDYKFYVTSCYYRDNKTNYSWVDGLDKSANKKVISEDSLEPNLYNGAKHIIKIY